MAKITPMPIMAQGLASYSVCGVQGRMRGFYSAWTYFKADSFTIRAMMRRLLGRFGLTSPWSVELAAAILALLGGVVLMPILIFYAGVASVGRYEGASLGHLYKSFFTGLGQASIASWVVLLGPYGLYLLFKGLRAWWQVSARLA